MSQTTQTLGGMRRPLMDSLGVDIGWDETPLMDSLGVNIGWDEMPLDALVQVFKRLPVEDRLQTIPQICKAWRKATFDPGCCQFVDLKE
ncbi:hypothetical protein R1flu_013670 [Riccia fluitans]|uniref:F-box domain-containing protein n=1 Tax=Riccia fluitans TaxID=41844 RepID=A0ABD1YDW7_9MARC